MRIQRLFPIFLTLRGVLGGMDMAMASHSRQADWSLIIGFRE
jgi:hypothetical protein